jgi:hypothetical protein
VEVAQVALPAHDNIARLELTHDLGEPPYQYWRVVPVDEDGNRGQASNVVSTVVGEPPEIISVSPTEGDSGTETTFSAEVTGDGPFEYSWNFGSGAEPNTSSELSPTVTLSHGGTLPEPVRAYSAALTVNTPYGSATYPFSLEISAWWHVEEIPSAISDGNIQSCTYEFGPDAEIWGIQTFYSIGSFVLRLFNGLFEYEARPGNAIGIDRESIPYVTHIEGEGFPVFDYDLYLAKKNGEVWEDEHIAAIGYSADVQMLFDSENRPVLIYADERDLHKDDLWVARKADEGWTRTNVYSAQSGLSFKACITSDDRLWIAFNHTYWEDTDLFFAEETGGQWEIEKLKDGYYNGDYTERFFVSAFVMEGGSTPVLLVNERFDDMTDVPMVINYVTHVARRAGSTWSFCELRRIISSHDGTEGSGTGLVVTPQGLEVVLYRSRYDRSSPWSFVLLVRNQDDWDTAEESIWDYRAALGDGLLLTPSGDLAFFAQDFLAAFW